MSMEFDHGVRVAKDLDELQQEPCALVWDDGTVQQLDPCSKIDGQGKNWTLYWDAKIARPGNIVALVIGDRVSVQKVWPGWGTELHITQKVVIE